MYHIIIAYILVGLLSIYYVMNRKSNFFKSLKIPYLTPLPLLGNMGPIVFQRASLPEFINKIYNMNKEAKYIGIYQFSTPVIFVRDLELIKLVTIKAFDHFTDHAGFIEPEQDKFFTTSMFFFHGNDWRRIRSRLSSAFTLNKIKSMYPLGKKCAETFGNHLVEKFQDKPHDIDAKDIFTKCTTDFSASCEYGCEVDSMKNPENDFYVLGRKAIDFEGPISAKFFFARSFPRIFKLFNIKMIENNVAEFFKSLVRDTVAFRKEKNVTRPDVLQILMDANESNDNDIFFSDDKLAGHAFSFFFGAFDTISTTMCFAFYEIAKNQDIQKRIQAEVDEVLERTGGNPNYEDINALKYLEAVINETLRLHPASAIIDRVCTDAFELPPATADGQPVLIQPGQTLWLPLHSVQRDPNYHQDPEKFNPDRFIGDAKNSMIAGTFFPFGSGPRFCIGQKFAMFEVKLVLFHLIARCEFSPSEKMKVPFKYSKRSFAILPEGGFWVKVGVRDSWKNRKF